MRPSRLLPACAAVPALALAQVQSFDVYTYEAPAGYTIKVGSENTELAKIDPAKRSFCQIGLYRAQKSLGTPQLDLEHEWKYAFAAPRRVTSMSDARALPLPQAPGSIMRGAQTVDSRGNTAVSALFVIRGAQRYVGVVFNASDDKAFQACQEDVTTVVVGLRMADGAAPAQTSSDPSPVFAAGSGLPAGVWERTAASGPSMTYNAFTKQWQTNFALAQFRSARRFRIDSNGQYVYELDHEDYNRSERSLVIERGTYTVADGVIRFQPKQAQEGKAPRGQQVPLASRATAAPYARRYSIGEHPSHKDSPGLQLLGEDGSWETFRALR